MTKHPNTLTYILIWILAGVCNFLAVAGILILAFTVVRQPQMDANTSYFFIILSALLMLPGVFLVRHVWHVIQPLNAEDANSWTALLKPKNIMNLWAGIDLRTLLGWYVVGGATIAVIAIIRIAYIGTTALIILLALSCLLIYWGVSWWRRLGHYFYSQLKQIKPE